MPSHFQGFFFIVDFLSLSAFEMTLGPFVYVLIGETPFLVFHQGPLRVASGSPLSLGESVQVDGVRVSVVDRSASGDTVRIARGSRNVP